MTDQERNQVVASLVMGQIRQYFSDLTHYFSGDEARFSRMVVDGGKALTTAHPQGWANHIINLSAECIDHFHGEMAQIFAQLQAWGLEVTQLSECVYWRFSWD